MVPSAPRARSHPRGEARERVVGTRVSRAGPASVLGLAMTTLASPRPWEQSVPQCVFVS